MNVDSRTTGDIGENAAQGFLQGDGYAILKTKYWTPFGEIDIIAQKDTYIVFVEVKYRKAVKGYYPREAVHRRKQKSIIQSAQYFIAENNIADMDFRFDVIEILGKETLSIEHIQNAFE